MHIQAFPATLRPAALPLAAAACLWLTACGGGSVAETPTEQAQALAFKGSTRAPKPSPSPPATNLPAAPANTLQTGITIPGFPHKLTIYRPATATKAIVFLHGHGGNTWQLAYDLGFNRVMAPQSARNVNWDWLARNGIIAVFAQGQALPAKQGATWNNYVSDSGQDDVGFLKALSTYVRSQYGVTDVSLSGHSAGGAMTARMWCEATTSYDAYVSLAGPMPSATYPRPGPPCLPQAPAPYYIVVGGKDSALPRFALGEVTPTPQEMAVGLSNTILISEWARHQGRSNAVCGETPVMEDETVDPSGPTWNACDARIRYRIVTNADHPIASLEQYAHVRMVDLIAEFLSQSEHTAGLAAGR